jgi:hypothetical protein
MAIKPRPHYAVFDFYAAVVESTVPFEQSPLRFYGDCQRMAQSPRWWSVRIHVLLMGKLESSVYQEAELVYTNTVKMLVGTMGEIINDDLNDRYSEWWHVAKGTATCSIIT